MNNRSTFRSTIAAVVYVLPFAASAQGYLENPVAGRVESGISLVSGWHCTAKEIRVYIDGVDIGKSGVGSVRNDTAPICGHANTGFSVLYNYNKLTPGTHSVSVYADGAHLETREFSSMRSGGVPFLEGVQSAVVVNDFPEAGVVTVLRWSQAKQSFVVEDAETTNHMEKVGDLLYRPFYGSVFRTNLPLRGDPAKISFEEFNGSLRFVREGDATGVCIFQGAYTATANGVNSQGTYSCDDATSGSYSAGNLQVNGLGVYSGSLSMKPTGGGASILEEHAAYDRNFGTPF